MDQRAAVVGRAMVVLVLLALCALLPAASAADIVWGSSSTFTQQAAGGDRYLAMCESMRLGSELAFNATNARSDRMGVLASRNLVTLFLDDNRNNTATALNTNALLARSDDDLLGLLVTSDGEGAATAFLSMTGQAIDSVPLVGPWSGLGLLQSPFKRWVFNTLPTSFQSLTYAIAKFLANDRLLSRFALLYPHPSLISGVDIRAGVEAKLALLGYRLASHYGVPSFAADPQTIGAAVANISAGEPQAVIMVVSSGQTSAFIKAAKAAMTRDDVIYILDGSVSNNITDDLTTERERENVYLVFPVPLLSDTDLPIVRDFWVDRDAHAPDWQQVVQPGALEGYINARWIVSVLEGMREPLNRAAFIDAVYSTPIRHVGGIAMGPFYDDCSRTGCQACCNAGSRRIYLVQFPNGTLEYVPNSVLEWQSCFPQPGDVRLPFKFGESVALTGDDARSGVAVRNGLASSFGATNAAGAFNGRDMVLIGYDDQSRPEENAGSNYEQLVQLDNVLALTGLRGIEAIAAALNHSSNAPVIGVSTGSPSLNSHFNRRLVRIAGSAYEELAGALDYFVGRLGFSRVGLYYESTPDGRLTLNGLVKALALRDLILAASVEQGDAVPTSGVELWLVYNPSGELVAPFLDSISSGGGTTPVCVLSSLDPDLLVDRINATSSASYSPFHAPRSQAQLAMLHFTQSLPNPNPNPNPATPAANGSGSQLAASFKAALAALDPNARPSYAALSGYLSGRLLAALISTINGQVTGDSLLAALYASGVIELDDLALGVYYDRCNTTGIPCCNAGSRSVHVVTPDGNANGTWSTQHTFDYDQCAFTFDASADDSGDGRSREEVLGIALGVALPVAALLVCCLVLVGLVALVASRRAAAARGLQEYTIDFDELELDGVLGQGGFGEVHKAVWKGTEVAVKLMPQGNVTREARQNFVDEVDIMSRLRHPNVILFMAASVKPPRLCIVMEYMELGSLYDLIHNELVPELPLLLKVKLVHQAAKGMHFLHSSEIVHRDLKSLNLLLDHKWNLKVADFGLTKFKDALLRQDSRDRDHAVVGSVPWMAPEVLGDEGRDQIDFVLADVYSFGIVLWELLTRDVLYEGMLPAQIAIRVIREDLRPALSGHTFDEAAHPRSAGEARYVELMRSCWKRDPTERPTFDEIITRLEGVKSAAGGGTGTSSTRQSTSSASSSPTASGTLPRSNYASTGTTTSSEGRPFDLHLRNVPRRDVSYAVCDLARMDELWQRDPFAAERTAESYGSLVRAQAAAHSGFVFSRPSLHSGGTYMLSFATTQAAAAFALALVAAVNDAGGEDGQLHQRSRVALHHHPKTNGRLPGDYAGATYEPNHYQEACRINLLGWPGAVLCSAAFGDACGADGNSSGVRLHNLPGREYSLLLGPDGDGDALAAHDAETEPERRGGLCSSNQCPWIIDGRRLTEGEWLGQGSYGQVTAGSYLGMPVAVKRLFNSKLDDDSMRRMRREAALLFNLEHPNLVKLVGLSIGDDAQLSLVMELVPGGSLAALLADSSRKLSWAARLSVLRDAALGLAFLHEHGVIHRDIKSSNLLVDDELGGAAGGGLRVKVADFGFATAKQENATMTRCGTPAWTAPEVLLPPQPAASGGSGGGGDGEEQHEAALLEKADTFSFGVVMWEVLTRKVPYQDNSGHDGHHHYNLGHLIQAVLDGKRPVVPSDCPPAFAKLMKRCWHRNPRKRPDMDQVLLSLNQLSGTFGP